MQNILPQIKLSIFGLLAPLLIAPSSNVLGQTTTVDFNLTLDTIADPGQNYRNFHKGGATPGNSFTIGFNIDITAVNSTLVVAPPVAAFCIELAEGISANSYTFNAENLHQVSAGRAGEPLTASSGIPAGGIGQLRAAQVRYLFDNYYQSTALSSWTQTTATPNVHAFQLALWELSHDQDLSLSSTSGSLYIGNQGTTNGDFTMRNNAIALAQSWLTAINVAGVTQGYSSTTFDIYGLTSVTGNTDGRGFQDVVLALHKATPESDVLVPLLPVPEPSSALLVLIGSMLVMRRRR